MKKILIVTFIAILGVGCSKTVETVNVIKVKKEIQISDMLLKIPVNLTDSGYKNLKSMVIKSEDEFKKFIADVKSQSGWSNRENFLEVIKESNIEFSKHNLVIYHFSESNRKTVTAVDAPIADGNSVVVKIGVEDIRDEKPKEEKMVEYALIYKSKKSLGNIIFNRGNSNINIKN